ncbi:MAG: hypothetical protein J6R32_02480 [Bacteroidales bacterium]|nr:hypothetical protein [Bacteroidales bacterium]
MVLNGVRIATDHVTADASPATFTRTECLLKMKDLIKLFIMVSIIMIKKIAGGD